MVERITRKETALNDRFCVNRHTVVCQSGMTDYVSVTIDNTDGFDFDFWTKQLCFEQKESVWIFMLMMLIVRKR